MALGSGLNWEIRPGHGSVNNGGAFVPCNYVSAATIQNPGVGYAVNDVLTLVGGTYPTGGQAQFTVTAAGAGLVTAITPLGTGGYTVNPTLLDCATTVAPVGGVNCSLNLTMTAAVDYSQYNDPAITWTHGAGGSGSVANYEDDLAALDVFGRLSSFLGSASFTGSIVGNVVKITAGVNATVGYYHIVNVIVGLFAVLDRDCAGIGDMTDATAYIGGATNSIDTIFGTIVAGNTVYLANTGHHDSITAARTTTAGSVGYPVYIIGYENSGTGPGVRTNLTSKSWTEAHNDAGFLTTTDYPVIDLGDNTLTTGVHNYLYCFVLTSTKAGQSYIASNYNRHWRVRIESSGNDASAAAASSAIGQRSIDCEYVTTGAASSRSISAGVNCLLHSCRIASFSGNGFSGSSVVLVNCLFHDIDPTKTAVLITTVTESFALNCTWDRCGTCISIPNLATATSQLFIVNAHATNCGTFLDNLRIATTVHSVCSFNNRLRDNTLGYVGFLDNPASGLESIGDILTDSDDATEYVDVATDNYKLTAASLAREAGIPIGDDCGCWPTTGSGGGSVLSRPVCRPPPATRCS